MRRGRQRDAAQEDEGLQARRRERQRAEIGWLVVKAGMRAAGDAEIVSGIDQQIRAAARPDGQDGQRVEIKVWRKGNRFALAVDGHVAGEGHAEDVLARVDGILKYRANAFA